MATYQIIGKRFCMATTVDEVSLNAEGQPVVTRRAGPTEVFEVGQCVADPDPELVRVFPDRFLLMPEPEPEEESVVAEPEPEPKRGRR